MQDFTGVPCVVDLVAMRDAITALGGFPFAPRQASLVSFVSVGVPAVALAAWAKPGPSPKTGLFKLLGRFVLPTAILLLLMSIAVYQIYAVPAKDAYLAIHPDASATQLLEDAYPAAQTALTLFASFCSILLVLFAVPPSKWFAGGAKLRGDWRIMGVVAGLLAWMVAVLAIPQGRLLFELEQLPTWHYFALFGAALLWAALCHLVWHSHILDPWLGTVEDPGNVRAKEKAAEKAESAERTRTGGD